MDKRTRPGSFASHLASNAERNLPRVSSRQTAKPGESPEREEGAVAVITQVENPRETDGGVPGLVPVAVLVLAVDQICDPASNGRIANLSGGHQSEQRPGSLRRSTVGRIAVRCPRPIGLAAFPPPPILVLASDEPVDS